MIQHVGRQFRLSREMKPFIVEDVDHLFFRLSL